MKTLVIEYETEFGREYIIDADTGAIIGWYSERLDEWVLEDWAVEEFGEDAIEEAMILCFE